MRPGRSTSMLSTLGFALAVLLAVPASAITAGPFGPNGEGGLVNGQLFEIGPGGVVFEIDSFLNIAGQDLNGSDVGTSAQLSIDPLPTGLDYAFCPSSPWTPPTSSSATRSGTTPAQRSRT